MDPHPVQKETNCKSKKKVSFSVKTNGEKKIQYKKKKKLVFLVFATFLVIQIHVKNVQRGIQITAVMRIRLRRNRIIFLDPAQYQKLGWIRICTKWCGSRSNKNHWKQKIRFSWYWILLCLVPDPYLSFCLVPDPNQTSVDPDTLWIFSDPRSVSKWYGSATLQICIT